MKLTEDLEAKSQALSWLLEIEALQDPTVLNALVLNVLKIDSGIKDVDFVVDRYSRRMLVYLKLGWFTKVMKGSKLKEDIAHMLKEALPSFTVRVTNDFNLFDKSLKLLEKMN